MPRPLASIRRKARSAISIAEMRSQSSAAKSTLHDIKPATVLALPIILRELKGRGYRIVHVEPATADRVKTATLPAQWLARNNRKWPAPKLSIEVLLANRTSSSRRCRASASGESLGELGYDLLPAQPRPMPPRAGKSRCHPNRHGHAFSHTPSRSPPLRVPMCPCFRQTEPR